MNIFSVFQILHNPYFAWCESFVMLKFRISYFHIMSIRLFLQDFKLEIGVFYSYSILSYSVLEEYRPYKAQGRTKDLPMT